MRVCRTGYTGEHGYELVPAWDDAPAVWEALVHEAGLRGGRPAGLGARDTLRTEMGYALHGQDLGPQITPVQARVGWAVGWRKPSFFGRDALLAERENGPRPGVLGSAGAGSRGAARASGGAGRRRRPRSARPPRGPSRRPWARASALALIDTVAGVAENDEIAVDVRGRRLRVRVVKPPFVPSHVR